MESTIAASTQPQVTVGVDAHKQFHVSPLLSMSSVAAGHPSDTRREPRYRTFVSWARSLGQLRDGRHRRPGPLRRGLARTCAPRASRSPKWAARSGNAVPATAKSDDADAAGAAAMVLAGEALGDPKSADGAAEMARAAGRPRQCGARATPRPTPPCRTFSSPRPPRCVNS